MPLTKSRLCPVPIHSPNAVGSAPLPPGRPPTHSPEPDASTAPGDPLPREVLAGFSAYIGPFTATSILAAWENLRAGFVERLGVDLPPCPPPESLEYAGEIKLVGPEEIRSPTVTTVQTRLGLFHAMPLSYGAFYRRPDFADQFFIVLVLASQDFEAMLSEGRWREGSELLMRLGAGCGCDYLWAGPDMQLSSFFLQSFSRSAPMQESLHFSDFLPPFYLTRQPAILARPSCRRFFTDQVRGSYRLLQVWDRFRGRPEEYEECARAMRMKCLWDVPVPSELATAE